MRMSLDVKRPQHLTNDEAIEILTRHGLHLVPAKAITDVEARRLWDILQALQANSSFIYLNDEYEGILSYFAPQYIYNFSQFLDWDALESPVSEVLNIPKKLTKTENSTSSSNLFTLRHHNEAVTRKGGLIPYLVTTSSLPSPQIIMNWLKTFDLRPISFLEGWEVSVDDYVSWIEEHQLKYEYLSLRKVLKPIPSDKVFGELLSLDRTLRGLRRSRALGQLLNLEGMEAFLVLRERKPIGYAMIDNVTGMIGPINTINDELMDVFALLGVELLANVRSDKLSFYLHSLSLIDEKPWLNANFKMVKIMNTFMSDFVGRLDFYVAPNLLLI